MMRMVVNRPVGVLMEETHVLIEQLYGMRIEAPLESPLEQPVSLNSTGRTGHYWGGKSPL